MFFSIRILWIAETPGQNYLMLWLPRPINQSFIHPSIRSGLYPIHLMWFDACLYFLAYSIFYHFEKYKTVSSTRSFGCYSFQIIVINGKWSMQYKKVNKFWCEKQLSLVCVAGCKFLLSWNEASMDHFLLPNIVFLSISLFSHLFDIWSCIHKSWIIWKGPNIIGYFVQLLWRTEGRFNFYQGW
jgi:hypothetical protein